MEEKKRNLQSTAAFSLDEDDAPELADEALESGTGVWRIGGKPVPASEGRRAMRVALVGKSRINIHLDNDVIAYFKNLARGRGYQTLINAALRQVMEAKPQNENQGVDRDLATEVAAEVLRVIREEFTAQRPADSVRFTGELTGEQVKTVQNWN